jgi:hypothetical protein
MERVSPEKEPNNKNLCVNAAGDVPGGEHVLISHSVITVVSAPETVCGYLHWEYGPNTALVKLITGILSSITTASNFPGDANPKRFIEGL